MIKFLASVGGTGYSRVAPGTCGSFAALVVYFLINGNVILCSAVTLALLIIGFAVSGKAEKAFGKKDASQIVIDEACGLFITLFLIPFSYGVAFLGFLIFRTADVAKPFPIRRLEKLPGSLGVMSDDILAGIYANLITRIILKLLT
ncbi:MAG: phosphatidylglycerophosphatase A [Candidatus Omnitrophica bacterium]|nr:phosphatidylglycerophosphatase A [Candidatus Omnitrophota bacterium]